ncbi:hypothetical protein J5N97_011106 [Dioscorea zingiberensis]|uniref:Uncharacterized protein n=1 Tax=Dioscorea zingiberensis TaxID=325984 RepID=A0A9D5CZZ9_9LILI|nr:hypothetical protein J5N97_011106 [Dioscorea zingiberensis]
MFSIAAINDTDSGAPWEPLAPTKEAQEFHLTQTYHEGLLKLQAKDYAKARELLETVLKDPQISSVQVHSSASDSHMLQLRFLTLKNLATVFLEQGSNHYENALRCYLQAAEIDANDSVVWNQLGTLSCTMGLLSTSRWAFEQGLLCSPNNWNCMEKLLEVLIAIGDEVACLSVADLILRHWPSHSRALHVKNTIEDLEPAPFAPRGIDKLEPKHARLKFREKRKAKDDELDGGAISKKPKQNIEVELAGATWTALAGAVLGIIRLTNGEVSVPGFAHDYGNETREQAAHKQADVLSGGINTEDGNLGTIIHGENGRFANINIELCLPASSKILTDITEGKGEVVCPVSTSTPLNSNGFQKTSILNEKEIYAEKEQHQERRSSRLERLRSRKSGKEDMEFANSKDLEKLVFQFLEPFTLSSETRNRDYAGILDNTYSKMHAYSSVQEYNDVVQFISETSKNHGACHIGHLFLERVAHVNIPFQDNFDKVLQLEKLTRHWGQDRTPLCSLFLAELCYDQGQSFADESKRLELYSDASYHLCKVIELVALDSSDDLFGQFSQVSNSVNNMGIDGTDQAVSLLDQQTINSKMSSTDRAQDLSLLVVKDSLSQESSDQDCVSINDDILWVRFFWLSGHLSVSSGCMEKALKYLEINLLKLEAFLRETTYEMMEKEMYKDCIKLLKPHFCFQQKMFYLDEMSGTPKEIEKVVNVELSALDVLLLACEKVEPMDIHVYLTSHQRKLQVLSIAAGMVGPSASEKWKSFTPNVFSACDLDHREAISKQWIHKDGFKQLVCIIGDIQSLVLNVMCGAVRLILNQKVPNSSTSNQMDQMEIWCLVDAVIAFCKLQHLDPSVPVKTQEYGLCCAGRDSAGKEGSFLKFAMKHLLALGMKLKSLNGRLESEANQRDGSASQPDHEKTVVSESSLSPVLEIPTNRNEEIAPLTRDASKDMTEEHISTSEEQIKVNLDRENDKCIQMDIVLKQNDTLADIELEKVELGIDNALDQSFLCLYGLNINPDSSGEDDLATHKNTSHGDYQTKEQCADVFQYILPYAKDLSRAGLVKLRRVLRAIRKHFPQPPDEILAENAIEKFLDDPNLCEDTLAELPGSGGSQESIINVLYADGRGPESFKTSSTARPDWIHAFYLGKLCEKMGFASEKALSYYSKAASLNPSAVDPAYRMHASRLKLLYTRGKENINIIQVVTAYAFSQSAKEEIMNMFNWSSQDLLHLASHIKDECHPDDQKNEGKNIEPHLLDKAWHILYDDCLSALEICVEGELKHFHKARYKLAQGLYRRGEGADLERAKDELSFCFKSSRSAFTINMWEIDGTAKKGRRKNPGLGGNRRVLEVSLSESSRKFITCIRKYILLYLILLEKTGDLCTLERAYIYLRTDKRFSLCLGDIVPIALGKYIQRLSSIIRNAESSGSSDKTSSGEQMLDRMFTTLMDHVHLWSDISTMPEVNSPDLSESNLCGYIHQYIHLLESDTRSDALEAVNEKIRKRFKNPKLCSVNSAKICKHASLAWFRSILMKLVSITSLPDSEHVGDQVGGSENDLLYVDLEPDELLSSSVEGIALYSASSSKFAEGGPHQTRDGNNHGFNVLDLSIPRKLLLWAYTLVHGRYSNISAVVKFCEENAKSRMRRGIPTHSVVQPASVPTGYCHSGGGRERNDRDEYVDSEDNPSNTQTVSSHQEEMAHTPNSSLATNEPVKYFDSAPQLQKCNSTKATENVQEECKGSKTAD